MKPLPPPKAPPPSDLERTRQEVEALKGRVAELTAPPTADEEVWIRMHRNGAGLAILELRTRGDKVVSRRMRKEHDITEVAMGRAHQYLIQDAEPNRDWSDKAPV